MFPSSSFSFYRRVPSFVPRLSSAQLPSKSKLNSLLCWWVPYSSPLLGDNLRATAATYKEYEKSRQMQKLLYKKGAKTRKHWYKSHLGEALEVATKKTKRTVSHSHNIRLRQLSHVLYDKVIDIINTGELSQEVLDKQVSITAVKVAKDVNSVSVYWEADRNDWKDVEDLLVAHSGKLRSLLISYHVLGRIPHVVFVKDESATNLHQLTELFQKADYGPDYVPGVNNTEAEVVNNDDDDNDDDHFKDTHEISHNNLRLKTGDSEASGFNQSSPGKMWILDDLSTRFDNSPKLSGTNNNYNNNNTRLKSEIEFSHHPGEDKVIDLRSEGICSDSDKYKDGHKNSGDKNSESAVDISYRSDIYGLDRAGLMRKILAKKSKSIDSRTTNEFVDMKQSMMPSIDLSIDPKESPSLPSSFLTKIKLQKKLVRNEKKRQQRMLERHSEDF